MQPATRHVRRMILHGIAVRKCADTRRTRKSARASVRTCNSARTPPNSRRSPMHRTRGTSVMRNACRERRGTTSAPAAIPAAAACGASTSSALCPKATAPAATRANGEVEAWVAAEGAVPFPELPRERRVVRRAGAGAVGAGAARAVPPVEHPEVVPVVVRGVRMAARAAAVPPRLRAQRTAAR